MPLVAEYEPLRRLFEPADVAESRLEQDEWQDADDPRSHPSRGPVRGRPIDEVLARRRSTRDFVDGPIDGHEVRAIVAAGRSFEARQWPRDRHRNLGVTMAVAAFDVTGLDGGLYLSDRLADTLHPVGGPSLVARLRDEYAAAPAVILVYGDIARATQALGTPGYGQLLVHAGAAAHAALLQALTWGLDGCLFGDVYAGDSSHLPAADGGVLRHLFTLAIGRGVRVTG